MNKGLIPIVIFMIATILLGSFLFIKINKIISTQKEIAGSTFRFYEECSNDNECIKAMQNRSNIARPYQMFYVPPGIWFIQ